MPKDEHFVPSGGLDLDAYLACGDAQGAHHLVRYEWALRVLSDRAPLSSLLDLGSGQGYPA